MPKVLVISLMFLVAGAGCSDDSKPPIVKDRGADRPVLVDRGLDLGKGEAMVDRGRDRGPEAQVDAKAADKGVDGPKDLAGKDLALDAGKLDAGLPAVWGYVTRSVTPVNDGVGDLVVTLNQVIFPFPIGVASTLIKRADLEKSGAKVKFQINATVAAGNYTLTAWMDDNNNPWVPIPLAADGDLVMSKAVQVTLSGSLIQKDLVLDKVQTVAGDGGLGGGAIKGRVTAKVAPSGDGKGTLCISLFKGVPPTGPLTATILASADLSSPFMKETYYIGGLASQNLYVQVFLDDNANVNLLSPAPDKGDLIHAKPVPAHVVSGQLTIQDIVLDAQK